MRAEKRLKGLPPVAGNDARVLILGSFPGTESLRRQQYYAHPQNDFWKIMFGVAALRMDYSERVGLLKRKKIALWDVIKSCFREGSSDSSIKDPEINDIKGFLGRHQGISKVFLNGTRSTQLFKRTSPAVEFQRLPSTSPRNATYSFYDKFKAWSEILEHV